MYTTDDNKERGAAVINLLHANGYSANEIYDESLDFPVSPSSSIKVSIVFFYKILLISQSW
jgi:hypothetical protein